MFIFFNKVNKYHKYVHFLSRGTGLIERLMENLLAYLNDDRLSDTDPLLKMCIAHYQFEAIHPFPDGNGRTGRILNLPLEQH